MNKSRNISVTSSQWEQFGAIAVANQHLEEEKAELEMYQKVEILPRKMRYSEDFMEEKFISRYALRVKRLLFPPSLVLFGYSIYSLFWSDWGTPGGFLGMWHTPANVAFNVTWILLALAGIGGMLFALFKRVLLFQSEIVFMGWTIIIVTLGLLFGNRWKVCRLLSIDLSEAFELQDESHPDSELLLVLSGIVIYLGVNVPMRFRVMAAVTSYVWLLYACTGLVVGVPGQYAQDISGNRAAAGIRTFCLSILYAISLFGKVQMEMILRESFLDLELSQCRIKVLKSTIDAVNLSSESLDNTPQTQGEKTQCRLASALKLLDQAKLLGATKGRSEFGLHLSKVLDSVAVAIKSAEVDLVMTDLKMQATANPLVRGGSNGEIEKAVQAILKPPRGSAEGGDETPLSTHDGEQTLQTGYSTVGFTSTISEHFNISKIQRSTMNLDELGTSARSLLREVGAPWAWKMDVFELEKSLHENGSTTLSAFELVGRAVFKDSALRGTKISWESMEECLHNLFMKYRDIPFHNAYHAAQVTHHAACLVHYLGLRGRDVNAIERVGFFVASLAHDVGHFGRNNNFLLNSQHELALSYNDISVLQNFHASTTFRCMLGSADILDNLTPKEVRRLRSLIIQLILSTDAGTQLRNLSDLRMRVRLLVEEDLHLLEEDEYKPRDRKLLFVSALAAAEYGFAGLAWGKHREWASRLTEEMVQQGEDEVSQNLPLSPLCDPEQPRVVLSSSLLSGLIDLCALPLYDQIRMVVEDRNMSCTKFIEDILTSVESNKASWTVEKHKFSREKSSEEEDMNLDEDDQSLFLPSPRSADKRVASPASPPGTGPIPEERSQETGVNDVSVLFTGGGGGMEDRSPARREPQGADDLMTFSQAYGDHFP